MGLDQKLKEIKERCEAATEGPWKSFAGVLRTEKEIVGCNDPDIHKYGTKDSLFIAHARTDVPMLLEVIEKYQTAFETFKIIPEIAKKDFLFCLQRELEALVPKNKEEEAAWRGEKKLFPRGE